jgi:NADH-quinone oxidoreductase subunit L
MTSTVTVLAFLSLVGGWIQMAGIWHPLSDWLHVVAPPRVEPSVLQDWITSLIAVSLGAAGIWLAWLMYVKRTVAVPRVAWAQRAFERKFYFDELYDLAFYRPAVWISRTLYRGVEQPLVSGSIAATATSVREVGRTTTVIQSGYLRSYVLALMTGLAVLAVLFVAFR